MITVCAKGLKHMCGEFALKNSRLLIDFVKHQILSRNRITDSLAESTAALGLISICLEF